MIDVHIGHMPEDNPHWWKQCEESLKDHPITVHNFESVKFNTRKTREIGFSLGTHPFVSFVDPDDFVYPGAFQKCLDILLQYPDVVGVNTLSNKIKIHPNGRVERSLMHPFVGHYAYPNGGQRFVHQLTVMRRDAVLAALNENNDIKADGGGEMHLYKKLCKYGKWYTLNFVGYCWRDHPKGVHHLPFSRWYKYSL